MINKQETSFALFHETYPIDSNRVSCDIDKYDIFVGHIPKPLISEWENFGFGSYGNGFLWLLDPFTQFLNPEDWNVLDGSGIEILRTAFADFCIYQNNQFIWLNILSGKHFSYGSVAEILFDSLLIQKNFRQSVLMEPLFKYALNKFNIIDANSCYGFAPLPALGGDLKKEYLIKAPLREYLSLVAQVSGR